MNKLEKILSKEKLPDLELIFVEGGTFWMGSKDNVISINWEKPMHQVKISSFYMAKYPTTQGFWTTVVGKENNPSCFKGDNRPVERVSWEVVEEFIFLLNKRTGKDYRLPTEAEWEYAARGGNQSKGFFYSGSNNLKEVGWCRKNSYGETKEVGLLRPNEVGLYDMSGNVFEYCQDWINTGGYYEDCRKQGIVKDPLGPKNGIGRVARGGSWLHNSLDCRCTFRSATSVEYRKFNFGVSFGVTYLG